MGNNTCELSKKINRIVTMNTVIVFRIAAGVIQGFARQTTFSCGESFLRTQAKTQPIGNTKKEISKPSSLT
jgi:hypothetical protein